MVEIMELYGINIDDDVQYMNLFHKVSSEQRERVLRFRFLEDIKRTLYGDIVVRYLACKKLCIKNEDMIFEQNIYGKPYLLNSLFFHYNISHSGNWVICAVDEYPVGVDIEKIRLIDLNIARRYFTRHEYESIIKEGKENQQKNFYNYWTAKESYLKYIGRGLSMPLDSFSVIWENNGHYKVDTDTNCSIDTLEITNDYIISICHQHVLKKNELKIKIIKMEEIEI